MEWQKKPLWRLDTLCWSLSCSCMSIHVSKCSRQKRQSAVCESCSSVYLSCPSAYEKPLWLHWDLCVGSHAGPWHLFAYLEEQEASWDIWPRPVKYAFGLQRDLYRVWRSFSSRGQLEKPHVSCACRRMCILYCSGNRCLVRGLSRN